MATAQIEVESRVIELSTEAFKTFCEDMSGMFGVDMECEQQEVAAETLAGLEKRFKKLVAVNIIDSKGLLDGTFQFVFGQEGLFTLGGVIVMLPEQRIMANRKDASAELAERMVDAVGEAGNLLTESWDKVFSEGLDGHGQFSQRLPAFVGKPWDKPQEKIGLAKDEELVFVPYEMTIASFPAFNCGVVFPKTIFGADSESGAETAGSAQETEQQETQDEQAVSDGADPERSDEAHQGGGEESEPEVPAAEQFPAEETAAEEEAKQVVETDTTDSAEQAAPVEKEPADEEVTDEQESAAEHEPEALGQEEDAAVDASATDDVAEEEVAAPDQSNESAGRGVSETIRKMTQSPAVPPGEPGQPTVTRNATISGTGELLGICAKDIMQKDLVWASPGDSVEQALAKMQHHDAGYIMIGHDGALQAIVSKSDIAGAISPYLRPIFAKWRRPSDDTTLQIKIKWIMSRPVRTTGPETPLATVMENMCRFGGRALPVVDEQGKVLGLVTAFDIFRTLLNASAGVPTVGKSPQGPPLT